MKEDIQIVIRHMKTCSASLILTQTQSKSNKVSPHTGQDGHLKTPTKIYVGALAGRVLPVAPPGKPYSNIK